MHRPGTPVTYRPLLRSGIRRRRNHIRRLHQSRRCDSRRRHIRRRPLIGHPGVLNSITEDARSPAVVPTDSTRITFPDRPAPATAGTCVGAARSDRPAVRQRNVFSRGITRSGHGPPPALVSPGRDTLRRPAANRPTSGRRPTSPRPPGAAQGRADRLTVDIFRRRVPAARRPAPDSLRSVRTAQGGLHRSTVRIFRRDVTSCRRHRGALVTRDALRRITIRRTVSRRRVPAACLATPGRPLAASRTAGGGLHGRTVHEFRRSITPRRRRIVRRSLITSGHNTSRERGQSTIGSRDILGRRVTTTSRHTTAIRTTPNAQRCTGRIIFAPGGRQVGCRPLIVAGRNATRIRGCGAVARRRASQFGCRRIPFLALARLRDLLCANGGAVRTGPRIRLGRSGFGGLAEVCGAGQGRWHTSAGPDVGGRVADSGRGGWRLGCGCRCVSGYGRRSDVPCRSGPRRTFRVLDTPERRLVRAEPQDGSRPRCGPLGQRENPTGRQGFDIEADFVDEQSGTDGRSG